MHGVMSKENSTEFKELIALLQSSVILECHRVQIWGRFYLVYLSLICSGSTYRCVRTTQLSAHAITREQAASKHTAALSKV